MQENYHILVVDDDARLRRLLVTFLVAEGYFVSSARDADEADDIGERFRFDALVLDVMMPGRDGISYTSARRAAGDATPIILLTAMGEAEHRIRGLEAGADDYLPKPFEPRELSLRLAAILKRRPPITAEAVRFGDFRYEKATQQLRRGDTPVALTLAERALLHALASQQGQPVSRDTLLAALQPTAHADAALDSRAVDVQLMRLRRKLGDDPKQPLYIQTVRGKGYRLYG